MKISFPVLNLIIDKIPKADGDISKLYYGVGSVWGKTLVDSRNTSFLDPLLDKHLSLLLIHFLLLNLVWAQSRIGINNLIRDVRMEPVVCITFSSALSNSISEWPILSSC